MAHFGYLSLLPAIVTIIVAIMTHRVATALFAGIVSASFVLSSTFSIIPVLKTTYHYIFLSFCDAERIKIAFFLFFVGAMLNIIDKSGGYVAFSKWIQTLLNTAKKSRIAIFILSLSVFIDDYANVLVCGASMRSVSSIHNISPALLTYVVDRTATVASFVMVSTWAAFESSLMQSAGSTVNIAHSGTEFFIQSLPFHSSTYFGIFLVGLTVLQGRWFGAYFDSGELLEFENKEKNINSNEGKLSYIFFPLLSLILCSLMKHCRWGMPALKQKQKHS